MSGFSGTSTAVPGPAAIAPAIAPPRIAAGAFIGVLIPARKLAIPVCTRPPSSVRDLTGEVNTCGILIDLIAWKPLVIRAWVAAEASLQVAAPLARRLLNLWERESFGAWKGATSASLTKAIF